MPCTPRRLVCVLYVLSARDICLMDQIEAPSCDLTLSPCRSTSLCLSVTVESPTHQNCCFHLGGNIHLKRLFSVVVVIITA